MLPYCLKCRKNTKQVEQCFYQNVHCVKVKNRNFLNNKKLEEHLTVRSSFVLKVWNKWKNKQIFISTW